jgi:hypothetical protein
MTTYTWSVTNMQVYPQSESEINVVCAAAWNVAGTDGTYNGSLNGSTAFKLDPSAPYTPYADLTQEQVLGWIFASIGEEGKKTAQADIDAQIAYAASKVTDKPVPWAASGTTPV